MIFNINWWDKYIKSQFLQQIILFAESIENRLIPTFDCIEDEAEKIAEKEWNDFCSSYCDPDSYIDPSDFAERAQEAGINYYSMLSGVKQSILNIAITTLYHLYEQQVIFFLRKAILHPSEENDQKLMKTSEFKKRLLSKSIDITKFECWPKIEELRLIANTVKHAEGGSASKLREIRPDLFTDPRIKDLWPGPTPSIFFYMPLAGEDLFITIADINNYKNTLIDFWDAAIVAMYEAD